MEQSKKLDPSITMWSGLWHIDDDKKPACGVPVIANTHIPGSYGLNCPECKRLVE